MMRMRLVRSAGFKIALGVVAWLVIISSLRFKIWQQRNASAAKNHLEVGFLPVTCHLTCPVTDFASRTSVDTKFDSRRFSEFSTISEALKAGHMHASFLLAPLAMRLREQGVPIKIVYLGHRDGTQVVVRKENPARDLRDLKGKILAIPSFFSNQYLVLRKTMQDLGMHKSDIDFREMPPPDMPAALSTRSIHAYIVGEPFAAKAEVAGFGRVLYYAKDMWPGFISCVLVVREEYIAKHPDIVADLVRGIAESGEWAENNRLAAAKVAAPYFVQDEKLVRYVLTQPPDRVSYRMLTPTRAELEKIMNMAIHVGSLNGPIDLDALMDLRFIPKTIRPANIQP